MKTYDKIIFACDDDIQKRDRAIVELWDTLDSYVRMVAQTAPASEFDDALRNPILTKYSDFVNKTRQIYGIPSEETEEA